MASRTEGRWITIGGAKGKDGKRRGGSPVFVQGGRITKGHPSLTGKKISALGEASPADQDTHRQQLHQSYAYERARLFKRARAEGVNPDHVRQLAGEILDHRKAFDKDRGHLLRDARQALASFGGQWKTLKQNADRGRVEGADQVKGFDVVAADMANAYPHLFHGKADPAEQLYDMLTAGNTAAADEQQVLEEALDHLLQERERYRVRDDEAVPFSLEMTMITRELEMSLTLQAMRGRLARAEQVVARKQLEKIGERMKALVRAGALSEPTARSMWNELRAKELSLVDPAGDGGVSRILAQLSILEKEVPRQPAASHQDIRRIPRMSRKEAGAILDSVYGKKRA